MTKPRRHFGNVRKLPSGRWQAGYWHDGQRHVAANTFAAKADALAYLSNAETDLQRGQWVDPLAGKVSFSSYATDWLKGRGDLRDTTRAKYDYLLKRHILPTLGTTSLSALALAPSRVRSWYQELATQHATTADDAYRLLRAVLNTAKADRQISQNPCQVKGAGQVHSPERPVASVRDVAHAVEAVPERYRLALLLSAWCQLRRGEVLALQRRHFDMLHGKIGVEQAWVVPMGSKPVVGPPKTEAGARSLTTIPPNVLPAVIDHLERFVGPEPTAWLFGTSTGTALSPRNLNRVWSTARTAVGRPDLHLHDLRHSGLTWAAASGASVAELMRRGGHANPRAALRYQHATEDQDEAIAKALGKLARVESPASARTRAPGRPRNDPTTAMKRASHQHLLWSGRRDSNPRPSPWQGDALPTEPRPRCPYRLALHRDDALAWLAQHSRLEHLHDVAVRRARAPPAGHEDSHHFDRGAALAAGDYCRRVAG